MWQYRASVERIIDGDTYVLLVDCRFHVYTRISCRLEGVDTPEIRGVDKAQGHLARQYVEHLMPPGSSVVIRTEKDRKSFDRWVAQVTLADGSDLGKLVRAQWGTS